MLINHWHVAPEGTYDKDNPQKGTLAEVKEIMDKLGIEKAVAFAPFCYIMPDDTWYNLKYRTERECNEWLYQSLKDYPDISGFVTVNPKNPEAPEILSEYIRKGFRGAKIHPPIFQIKVDDMSLDKFYSTAEELNIPLLFHTGSHGWEIDKYAPKLLGNLAKRHPDLRIIIEHTGGTEFFYEALDILQNNPNCYAGITSTILKTIEGGRPTRS